MRCAGPLALLAAALGLAGCHTSNPAEWAADCDAEPVRVHAESAAARALLLDALEADGGAGISAAVLSDGELVWREAVGIATRGVPLTPAARMRIGSASKPVTASLALALVEVGQLDLRTPVAKLVAEVPHPSITAYQLGTHTSGIRHYDFGDPLEANNLKHYPDLTAALGLFVTDPLEFPPGEGFGYSSFGYNLLGVVIERAAGTPYNEVLSRTMRERFGRTTITIDDDESLVACRPGFHSSLFGRFLVPTLTRDNSDLYPSGGLLATAEDLARFTHQALDPAAAANTYRTSTIPPRLPDGSPGPYAFGWQVEHAADGSIAWIGHGGQTNGAYASVRHYPAEGVTIAAITNYNLAGTSRRAAFFDAVRSPCPLCSSKGRDRKSDGLRPALARRAARAQSRSGGPPGRSRRRTDILDEQTSWTPTDILDTHKSPQVHQPKMP